MGSWRFQELEELEPHNERGQQEAPRRLRRLCMRAVSEKLISPAKAADLLREPLQRVEEDLKGPLLFDVVASTR